MSSIRSELPPITITADDERRLSVLAELNASRFPHAALFLARELDRANVVPDESDLRHIVRMGSRVKYRDNATGRVREVTLVYPGEADINVDRISVLAPVGVALIGLSVGQTIEFQTPAREKRSLTVSVFPANTVAIGCGRSEFVSSTFRASPQSRMPNRASVGRESSNARRGFGRGGIYRVDPRATWR